MSKGIESNIHGFLQNVECAGNKLKAFSQSIQEKDQVIHKIIAQLSDKVAHLEFNHSGSEVGEELSETLKLYQQKVDKWIKFIHTYMNGQEFINQFDESILFVVFGNVNVGKSSIGNFIAGNNEGLLPYYKAVPDYYTYDFAANNGQAKPEKLGEAGFKENFMEETTSIQYYTLCEGLTWVDSPGIHSINGENEALAKKYVDYADLVLFVMSSSSPAKYDEFLELSRLMEKEKPLLVVINKSDRLDYDEVDGELVTVLMPKSKEDRAKQEQYVKDLFKEHSAIKSYASSVDSISISTHLAKEALEKNDDKSFEDSGVPRFYEKLGETLADNALEIKAKAPKQRVNTLIEDILKGFEAEAEHIDGLEEMEHSFEEILARIEAYIAQLDGIKNDLLKNVKIQAMPEIDICISKMSAKLQSGDNQINLKEEVEAILLKYFNEEIEKQVGKLLKDFRHERIKTLSLNMDLELTAKYETISYNEYSVKEVSRSAEGLLEKVGALFGKKYTRIKTSNHQVDKQILVGDNAGEVLERILDEVETNLQPQLEQLLGQIVHQYFAKEKELIEQILKEMRSVKKLLQQEKM